MALHPNKNIDITVETNSCPKTYRSRVEDIDEAKLLVAAPLEQGVIVPIRLQSHVIISYIELDIKEQGRFQARGIVTERYTKGNLSTLLIEIIGDWEKVQLRNYVRVNVLLDAKFNGTIPCIIKDISGGGLLVSCNEKLENLEKLFIDFALNDLVLRCDVKVVRIKPVDNGFEYGLAFIELDDNTREEIIRFVYKRQIEQYKRQRNQKS